MAMMRGSPNNQLLTSSLKLWCSKLTSLIPDIAKMASSAAVPTGVDHWGDVFSGVLTWDPKVVKTSETENIMNKIVAEMEMWHQLESFPFKKMPQYRSDAVFDVASVTSLLSDLMSFMEQVELSENQLVLKLLSASLQSESTRRNYVWWKLTDNERDLKHFAKQLLGGTLHVVLAKYSSSRQALHGAVKKRLGMMKTWAGVYSNGQTVEPLEEVFKELCNVHKNFQAWQAAVNVAVIRNCWSKYSSRLMSYEEIERELLLLDLTIKQPSSSPIVDPSDLPRGKDCTRDCITNTEYLYFSRGQSMQDPEVRKFALPVRTQLQRRAVTSEADSGLSVSPPSLLSSSWPESDVSGYLSEIKMKYSDSVSTSSYRVPCQLYSPTSPVYFQAPSSNCVEAEYLISDAEAEDGSDVFSKESITGNKPGWSTSVDITRCDPSLVDGERQNGFREFQAAVIPGQENPNFWANLWNLASISER